MSAESNFWQLLRNARAESLGICNILTFDPTNKKKEQERKGEKKRRKREKKREIVAIVLLVYFILSHTGLPCRGEPFIPYLRTFSTTHVLLSVNKRRLSKLSN